MPFPQRPGKHREPPLFTPRNFHRYLRGRGHPVRPVPATEVILFSRPLFQRLRVERAGPAGQGAGDPDAFLVGRRRGTVGVNLCGAGAPALAIRVEELAERGAERIVSVGYAGALTPTLKAGDSVLCTRALRDEGTSHHYSRPARFTRPPGPLTGELKERLRELGMPVRTGPTWTVDAIYRETRREVEAYGRQGILTVDMEAAALFAVSRYRKAEAAALFTISDHLTPRWRPGFHLAGGALESLAEATLTILMDS